MNGSDALNWGMLVILVPIYLWVLVRMTVDLFKGE